MALFPSGFQPGVPERAAWSARAWAVELYRGWEAVFTLEPEWRRLTEIHPEPSPCTSWEAVEALAGIGLSRGVPLVAAVRIGERIEGLFPFVSRKWTGGLYLRFLGGSAFPRHEALISPQLALMSPAMVLKRVARTLGRSVLYDLAGLRPGGFGSEWLIDGLSAAAGWHAAEGAREAAVSVEGGWDAVRVTLSGQVRDRAQSARGRLERQGGLEFSFVEAPDADEVEAAVAFARAQSGFFELPSGRFVHRLALASAARGRLLVALTRHRGEIVAMGLVWRRGAQAAELACIGAPDDAVDGLASLMRISLIEHLARDPGARVFLPPPGRATELLSPIPRFQVHLWGAPFPGLSRIAAQLGGWCGQNRELCAAPARWVRRLIRPPVLATDAPPETAESAAARPPELAEPRAERESSALPAGLPGGGK